MNLRNSSCISGGEIFDGGFFYLSLFSELFSEDSLELPVVLLLSVLV